MSRSKMNMCEGPYLKKVILYTLPIILTGLLQLTFNAADLIIVGQFSGSTSVGAVSATGSLTNLIVNLFVGLSVGAGVMVAQSIGAGHDLEVHRTIHTAIPLALISGVILMIIGVCFSEYFLTLMGTPDDVLPLSAVYMRIYFCGMPFSMLYNYGASILRAAGNTTQPLIFLSVAGVINVFFNWIFVCFFHMDVAGVALATTISQAISSTCVFLALCKRTDACRLEPKKLKFYRGNFLKMLRIGLPSGLQGAMFSISNIIIQSSVNSFGSVVLSGNGAASSIEGFLYTTVNSFSQSAVNFAGQNMGARRLENLKKSVYTCLGYAITIGLVLGTAMAIFSEPLLSIYITDSPEAIQHGMMRMYINATTYFLLGFMDVMTGALRGMGASIGPMFISILGVCGIRIGWVFTLFRTPAFHSLGGLCISFPISWFITGMAELIFFLILMRRYQKKWASQAEPRLA